MKRIFLLTLTIMYTMTLASCGGVFEQETPTAAETGELQLEFERLLEAQKGWYDFSLSLNQCTLRISRTIKPVCRAENEARFQDNKYIPVMDLTEIDLNEVTNVVWNLISNPISRVDEKLSFQFSREVANEFSEIMADGLEKAEATSSEKRGGLSPSEYWQSLLENASANSKITRAYCDGSEGILPKLDDSFDLLLDKGASDIFDIEKVNIYNDKYC